MAKNTARFAKPDDEVDALVPGGSGGSATPLTAVWSATTLAAGSGPVTVTVTRGGVPVENVFSWKAPPYTTGAHTLTDAAGQDINNFPTPGTFVWRVEDRAAASGGALGNGEFVEQTITVT